MIILHSPATPESVQTGRGKMRSTRAPSRFHEPEYESPLKNASRGVKKVFMPGAKRVGGVVSDGALNQFIPLLGISRALGE